MYEESVKSRAASSYKFGTIICKRSDLYKRLEVDRASHYKTALFETLLRLGNSDFKTKASKEFLIINCIVLFIRKIQLLSIILLTFENSKNITLESFLNWLLKLTRFDILCGEFNLQFIFLFILISTLWGLFISFCLIYFQIYYRRNVVSLPLVLVAKILGWTYENILFVPYLYSVGVYSKYTFFDNSTEITEYDNKNSSDYNTYWAIPLILGFPIIVIAIFFRTIYNCKPYYTKKFKRNRMYSLITLKDFFFQIILVFLSFYSSDLFFNIFCAIFSIYMVFQYFLYLPFVAIFDNLFEANTWILMLFGVISHQLSVHTNAKSVRALIIFFIYPCSWIIMDYFMNRNFDCAFNTKNQNPYCIEFKIRRLLLKTKSKNLHNNLRSQIKAIFTEATKEFLSFKLLFVWESLFYLRYEKDKSLALLKLSKINFSSQNILRFWKQDNKNKKNFFSYPDIEAEFLYYYYYNELINEESEKNLMLIRYIRDINQLNTKDLEVACDLWELYTKLSNISEHSPRIISKFCSILANSKKKYEKKAEKMVKRHHLDPLVLKIYGSYKEDLLGDIEGKTLLDNSKNLKGTHVLGIDKSSDAKFQGMAIMVVSGMPNTIGDILYLKFKNCL
ncbi:unnamed protein product [Blepharisma stoltei]|uniref:Uncharacterized protein n=1 Tax=Blepharisma stoltei TaxID=1481888 RepID=A0AAU9KF27_9CILI|nr:unnamed protein product [Blepharisma stoltei]